MGVGKVAFFGPRGGGVTSTTTCVCLWNIPLVERRKRRRRRKEGRRGREFVKDEARQTDRRRKQTPFPNFRALKI